MKLFSVEFLPSMALAIPVAEGGLNGAAAPATQNETSGAIYTFSFPYQVLPRSKESALVDGIRFDALVNELGPGWMPPNESVGIVRWYFDDGAVLCGWWYRPEAKMTFGQRGSMWWEQRPKELEAKTSAIRSPEARHTEVANLAPAGHTHLFLVVFAVAASLFVLLIFAFMLSRLQAKKAARRRRNPDKKANRQSGTGPIFINDDEDARRNRGE